MKINLTRLLFCMTFLLLIDSPSHFANAQQSESSVECDEASEPILINYGEHTVNCAVDPATDLDTFNFTGTEGDNFRINILSGTRGFDPRLEIRGPDGALIEDNACNGSFGAGAVTCSFTVEKTLPLSGTYFLAISDVATNETGQYSLQLEKIPPISAPPGISYNSSINDGINPATDVDFIDFEGAADTHIRISILSGVRGFDPRLEIRGPDGALIEENACNGSFGAGAVMCSFTVEKTLPISGTYFLAISDVATNEIGDYQINLQCLFGPCPGVTPAGPVCDVQLSQSSYSVGEVVTAQVAQLANPGPAPVAVEIKTWFEGFGASPTSHLNIGSDGTFVLPPGFDRDYGPMPLLTVTGGIQPGAYEFNCRLLDPVTGRPLTLDRNPFDVQ